MWLSLQQLSCDAFVWISRDFWYITMSHACRLTVRPATRRILSTSKHFRQFSSSAFRHDQDENTEKDSIDVEALLSRPTWSVSSLLPPKDDSMRTPEISSKQLHHLLRLSALPPPKDAEEEAKMLSTLSSQLHFVKEIQGVDTTGVEPLRSLRDETAAGQKEAELGMDAMKDALAEEEVRGKHHRRIRRMKNQALKKQEDDWDVLGTATRKAGRYFVVEGGKEG